MLVRRYGLLEQKTELCVTALSLNCDYKGHFQNWNVSINIILL